VKNSPVLRIACAARASVSSSPAVASAHGRGERAEHVFVDVLNVVLDETERLAIDVVITAHPF
jgi:hypothetical protein